jgi:hypothetical protein
MLLLLQAMREAWGQSAIGQVDMGYLSQIADPTVVMNAQRDPEVRPAFYLLIHIFHGIL